MRETMVLVHSVRWWTPTNESSFLHKITVLELFVVLMGHFHGQRRCSRMVGSQQTFDLCHTTAFLSH